MILSAYSDVGCETLHDLALPFYCINSQTLEGKRMDLREYEQIVQLAPASDAVVRFIGRIRTP